MCGIAGACWTDSKLAVDAAQLQRMTDLLTHRGPDDDGAYRADLRVVPPYASIPGIALGARRLAVIDVRGGHQPISNEDATIWVVLNGEIYNHADLRRRLEGAGHTFRTNCDTECLVHLYEDEGIDFVRHLTGMFAIALWDARKRQLLLARDRLGQKPLVYRHEPGRVLFASEIKSLLSVPGVPRSVDPSALDAYLTYQYVPHPNTIFRGISKLPPAHRAVFRGGQLTIDRYWQPAWDQTTDRSAADLCDDLRTRLTHAVDLRLQADVPLGAFLSGGVDSTLIVALMQQQSSQRVKTFSIGFAEPEYDETSFARRAAEALGTEHRSFRVTPDAVALLPKLAWHFDEPFGDSSAVPTWILAEETRREVTVALTGDGGDELFAGYPRYRAVHLGSRIDRLPRPLRALLAARGWQLLPGAQRKSWIRRIKRFSESLGDRPTRRYLQWIAIFGEQVRAELYSDDFVAQLPSSDPADFLLDAWQRAGPRNDVTAAAIADIQTYLPCDLMTKVDIASMAHSLECRQPFLDHAVVELAVTLPLAMQFRSGRGKRILQRTFGDLVPDWVFARPKMGFGVPLDHWFRDDLKEMAHDLLLDETATGRGIFRSAGVQQLLADHESGRSDHSDRLWSLLMLELWYREWID